MGGAGLARARGIIMSMRIPTNFDKCIICCEQPPGDWEHVIPQAIGGRLEADCICNKCNYVGSQIVSRIRFDPALRMAVENLESDLPASLFRKLMKGQRFVGKNEQGGPTVQIVHREGKGKVRAQAQPDGSLLIDTSKAPNQIRQRLERLGATPEQVEEALRRFDLAPENEVVLLMDGLSAIKWSTDRVEPDLTMPSIDNLLLLLIAYEYLALCLGKGIFYDYFDPVREAILGGAWPNAISVERLTTDNYRPEHRLWVIAGEDRLSVHIDLFGWSAYVVTFHGITYSGPLPAYLDNLRDGDRMSLIAPSLEEARAGNFYSRTS